MKEIKSIKHYETLKKGETTGFYLSRNAIYIGEIRNFIYNFVANVIAYIILIVIFGVK
jgi:hypothetical protein